MRNKWYVIGLLIPALLLVWAAISLLMGGNGMFWLVPAVLAVALGVAAFRVAQAASFTPSAPQRWDADQQSAGMSKWLKHRADDQARDDAVKADAARAARRPPAS